jgi:hypothetical protein
MVAASFFDQVKGSTKKHNQYKRMRVDKESI